MAKTMFATGSAQLSHGVSARDGLNEAAGLLYTLFIDNLDAVTFHGRVRRSGQPQRVLADCVCRYRDTQRRQFGEALRTIAGADAPQGLIDESVRLFEIVLLGMSMQRPFVSDGSGFRGDFDAIARMLTARLTEGLDSRRR